MSQPLAGTFTSLGQKVKDKARRRPKPGPEWDEPLQMSKVQVCFAAGFALSDAMQGLIDSNPLRAVSALYNGYLFIKGIHNHNITLRSAEEAPLRELLGDRAPANDNVLTPSQSLSNSYTLLSRACTAHGLSAFVNLPIDVQANGEARLIGTVVPAGLSMIALAIGRWCTRDLARENGPPRMPSITGKLAP